MQAEEARIQDERKYFIRQTKAKVDETLRTIRGLKAEIADGKEYYSVTEKLISDTEKLISDTKTDVKKQISQMTKLNEQLGEEIAKLESSLSSHEKDHTIWSNVLELMETDSTITLDLASRIVNEVYEAMTS
jgi:uncharacterized protein (DUF2252 family)